jgi:hypothetical protein
MRSNGDACDVNGGVARSGVLALTAPRGTRSDRFKPLEVESPGVPATCRALSRSPFSRDGASIFPRGAADPRGGFHGTSGGGMGGGPGAGPRLIRVPRQSRVLCRASAGACTGASAGASAGASPEERSGCVPVADMRGVGGALFGAPGAASASPSMMKLRLTGGSPSGNGGCAGGEANRGVPPSACRTFRAASSSASQAGASSDGAGSRGASDAESSPVCSSVGGAVANLANVSFMAAFVRKRS